MPEKLWELIGSNGAGKTTILKILSKIIQPTSGTFKINGRVSALIELGAGFHPDLTGRENIYLNGTILGLNRKEIERQYDSIVAFAELEEFINTPVKRYSSGMYARLGFAIAAHVDPEVLLVDEVLAVGDEAFQLKCRNLIRSFVKSGRTTIFVSHNLYTIEQLCDRVIWLDHGQIIQNGDPSKVLQAYMDEIDRRLSLTSQNNRNITGDELIIHDLRIMNVNGNDKDSFVTGEDILISIDCETKDKIERPYFCIWISEAHSRTPIFAANMILDDFRVPEINGIFKISCCFKTIPLMPRAYNVWLEVYGKDRSQLLYKWRVLGGFKILDNVDESMDSGEMRGRVRFSREHAFVKVPYEWIV